MRVIQITREVDQALLLEWVKKEPQRSTRNRVHALLLVAQGRQAQEVAQVLFIHPRTVSRTVRDYNEQGVEGLLCRAGGSAPHLTEAEEEELQQQLLAAPSADRESYLTWQGRDVQA